jgi:hypothetical protein
LVSLRNGFVKFDRKSKMNVNVLPSTTKARGFVWLRIQSPDPFSCFSISDK